jgi:chondroitin sulfate N-acetylgalactosaminyltransferase 1/2
VSQPVKASALRSEADTHHALLMIQREEENQQEIAKLKAEIKNLKLELFQLKNNPTLVSDQLLPLNPNASTASTQQSAPYQLDCTNYIRRQVGNAEILHGLPMNNEYELIPFNHFTFSRVYPIDLGLGKRVVEKPIGYKRKDLLDALNRGLESLNKNATATNQRYTLDDFIEGIYRNEPVTGTQYELYFRTKEISNKTNPSPSSSHHNDHGTTKLIVMRPFAPLQTIQVERFPKTADKEIIHIILPLSGRIGTFQGFMEKFVKIALKNDRRVQLSVVYFGEDGLADARKIMKRIIAQKSAYASNLKLLALNETFSRGKQSRPLHDASRDQRPASPFNCIFFFLIAGTTITTFPQRKDFVLVLSRSGTRTRAEERTTRTCCCSCAMWTSSSALNSSTVADGIPSQIARFVGGK